IPMVLGMPIMLISNVDVDGGATNGAIGTLKSIRYRSDEDGHRYLTSCIITTSTVNPFTPPNLSNGDIAIVSDTQSFKVVHK
ncbi:hypothetical protein BJ165DRAFT_1321417, partial [Panaeolus papilionaceus]